MDQVRSAEASTQRKDDADGVGDEKYRQFLPYRRPYSRRVATHDPSVW
jgi:hypothetical protein